jgi:hypothetical protein
VLPAVQALLIQLTPLEGLEAPQLVGEREMLAEVVQEAPLLVIMVVVAIWEEEEVLAVLAVQAFYSDTARAGMDKVILTRLAKTGLPVLFILSGFRREAGQTFKKSPTAVQQQQTR